MKQTQLTRYTVLLFPALLAVLLYSYTMHLPFFMDDGILFALTKEAFMANNSPGLSLNFLAGNPPSGYYFPYYRPLVFTFWEIHGQLLGGRFEPSILHWVNVLVYALIASGVSALAHRLTGKLYVALIAGVMFVTFPFNYNAVMWIASLFHLVAVMGMVLAVYFGLVTARAKQPFIPAILTLLSAMIGVFSHENGVLIPPLLLGALILKSGTLNPLTFLKNRKHWLALSSATLPVIVYLFLYLTMDGVGNGFNIQPTVLDSLGVFLQGLVYPTTSLVRVIFRVDTTVNDSTSTLIFFAIALVTLAPILWMLYRFKAWGSLKLTLYAIGWYVLAALPTVLFLEQSYIVGSWRLLLVSSVGMALFWGVSLTALWDISAQFKHVRLQQFARVIVSAILIYSLILSGLFLTRRSEEALVQAQFMDDLYTEIQSNGTGEKPLIINAPQLLATASDKRLFPSFGTGVIYVASFFNWNMLYEAQTGEDFPLINALIFRETLNPPERFSYAPFETFAFGTDFTTEVRNASDLYVTVFDGEEFYPRYVGSPDNPAPFDASNDGDTLANFESAGVTLINAQARLRDESTLEVDSRWRVDTANTVMPAFTVTCDDTIVAEDALSILGGIHPFRVWQSGEIQTDRRTIVLDRPVTPECLAIELILTSDSTAEVSEDFYPDSGQAVQIAVESE